MSELRRNRAFNIFWFGQACSVLGNYAGMVALPLLVLQATGSVAQMGLVTGIQGVGTLAAGLVAGPVVDRIDRRRLMIGCDLTLFVLYLLVPLVWYARGPTIWLIYPLALLAAVLKMFFSIAYVTAVPSLVTQDQIIAANGRLETTYGVAGVVGPALAGLLTATVGPVAAIGLDAVTFLASAGSLSLIQLRPVAAPPQREGPLREIVAGVQFLRATPILRTMTLVVFGFSLILASTESLVIYAIKHEFHQGDQVVGLVLGAAGVGAALASAAVAWLRRRIGFGASYLGGVALSGLGLALAGMAQSLWVFAAGVLLFYAADMLAGINSMTVRQEVTPDYLLGRVTAAFWTIVNLPIPFGAALLTGLAERQGVRGVLVLLGGFGVALATAGLFTAIRTYVPGARPAELRRGPAAEAAS